MKCFETHTGSDKLFDEPVILLNNIVQIFILSQKTWSSGPGQRPMALLKEIDAKVEARNVLKANAANTKQ